MSSAIVTNLAPGDPWGAVRSMPSQMRGGDWWIMPWQQDVKDARGNLKDRANVALDMTAPNPLYPNTPGNPNADLGGLGAQAWGLANPWVKIAADLAHNRDSLDRPIANGAPDDSLFGARARELAAYAGNSLLPSVLQSGTGGVVSGVVHALKGEVDAAGNRKAIGPTVMKNVFGLKTEPVSVKLNSRQLVFEAARIRKDSKDEIRKIRTNRNLTVEEKRQQIADALKRYHSAMTQHHERTRR